MCIACMISSAISALVVVAVLVFSAREKREMLRMIGTGTPDAVVIPKAGKTAQARVAEAWRGLGNK